VKRFSMPVRKAYSAILATCALLAISATAAATALAGEATLWACHGPGGQPLGVTPAVGSAFGEALVTTYGSACSASVSALADGGLRAAFTRPDPTGSSQAYWRVGVPAGVELRAVRLTRRTSGFGGMPAPGGGQYYATETSSAVLERASVADATNVALDGELVRDPAGGSYVRFGVACVPSAARCAAPGVDALAVEAGSIALRVGDDAAPRGAVGGVSSPASGTLALTMFATDAGLGLASATASLDGTPVVQADLGGASCAELSAQDATIDLPAGAACPPSSSAVALPVDTTAVPDGPHALRVELRDAAGNAVRILDEQITVSNAVVPHSSQALLTIGTGAVPGPGPGGSGTGTPGGGSGTPGGGSGTAPGGGAASSGPACRRPRLSMSLRGRPLRMLASVPVLLRSRAYRYSGRLTCLVAGRRVGAPRGTVVEILNKIGRRYYGKSGTTVRARGAVSVLLRYPSARIVRFRHRSVDGSSARVDIRIAIARHAQVRR
jgi:hypothetical protein